MSCKHCWHEVSRKVAGANGRLERLLLCCHCGAGNSQSSVLVTDEAHGRYQPVRYEFLEDA